jgi:hypothetical protein
MPAPSAKHSFPVGDNPFPIVSQSVIELETAEGALLRRAGKESQMAEEVTGVLPHRRLWISSLIVGGKESYQQQSACSRRWSYLDLR